MSQFSYVAINARGHESRGTMDVLDQPEALRRIKEMGLHPVRLIVDKSSAKSGPAKRPKATGWRRWMDLPLPGLGGSIKAAELASFTRNLATLIEAAFPFCAGSACSTSRRRTAR